MAVERFACSSGKALSVFACCHLSNSVETCTLILLVFHHCYRNSSSHLAVLLGSRPGYGRSAVWQFWTKQILPERVKSNYLLPRQAVNTHLIAYNRRSQWPHLVHCVRVHGLTWKIDYIYLCKCHQLGVEDSDNGSMSGCIHEYHNIYFLVGWTWGKKLLEWNLMEHSLNAQERHLLVLLNASFPHCVLTHLVPHGVLLWARMWGPWRSGGKVFPQFSQSNQWPASWSL